MNPSAFPTVATVIGFTPEPDSGPLVATLACPITSEELETSAVGNLPESVGGTVTDDASLVVETDDPVTKAVVDNIIGNLPTKKQVEKLRCDICNIEVLGKSVLDSHFAGAKHSKKVKLIESMAVQQRPTENTTSICPPKSLLYFKCEVCNISVNSIQQLQVHCQGAKHKNNIANLMNTSDNQNHSSHKESLSSQSHPASIAAARFSCPACNINVNSEMQLKQHEASKKHAGRISVNVNASNYSRVTPYTKKGRNVTKSSNDAQLLKCQVCNICTNSAVQLQQHYYSRKHNDKLIGKPDHIDTSNTLPPQTYIKKNYFDSAAATSISGDGLYKRRDDSAAATSISRPYPANEDSRGGEGGSYDGPYKSNSSAMHSNGYQFPKWVPPQPDQPVLNRMLNNFRSNS